MFSGCYILVTNYKDKRFKYLIFPNRPHLVAYIAGLLKYIKISLIVYKVGNKTVK